MPERKIRSITIEFDMGPPLHFTPEDIEKAKEWEKIKSLIRELRDIAWEESLR